MARLQVESGINTELLTAKMRDLEIKLGDIAKENSSMRGALETRSVALSPYLPLNSKEGFSLLFRVCKNLKVSFEMKYF
jgi:hypothetical protein